ncbi:MAG: flagellar basal-body rod protein FlgG [Chloroflexi bacterium]|nr:flagellar basal-body rod protein FlgG [Chloroflexota bacterium]
MLPILQTAATGLVAQRFKIDALANNVANVDTGGFKRMRVSLRDVGYVPASTIAPEIAPEQDAWVGIGVQVASSQMMFDQGALQFTGNGFDLAISGEGFFQVKLADGTTGYTRGGSFGLDASRRLVDANGRILLPGITMPEDAVVYNVAKNGEVTVLREGEESPEVVGQLQLARFANPGGLLSAGQGVFKPTAASGESTLGQPGSAGYGEVMSGALETSNVDIADEMTSLVQAMRAYQLTLKVVKSLDDILALANQSGTTI